LFHQSTPLIMRTWVRLLSIGLDGLALGEPALDARLHLRVRMLLRDAYRIVIGIRRTHLARGGGSERVGRVRQHGATGSRLCRCASGLAKWTPAGRRARRHRPGACSHSQTRACPRYEPLALPVIWAKLGRSFFFEPEMPGADAIG
jgi:hypothetical protein